jgi:aminoglycoside phosphotransferase (APT) family kinase protein
VPGRNRNLRVLGGPGHNYFLKQAPRGETGPDGPLAVEAALYQWAATDPAAAGLRPLLPSLRLWDSERSILVLDLVPSTHPVPDDASAEYQAALRRLLAEALATCHRLPADGTAAPSFLPAAAPWICDLARPVPSMLRELSPAQLSLIQALQAAPDAVEALERLRDEWRPTRLIHGDIKWNNVLVRLDAAAPAPTHPCAPAPPRPSASAPPRSLPSGIVLLDWELAQLGDPAWDVGAVLHAFILDAVLELEPAKGAGPGEVALLLGGAMSRLHPAHREFLTRYAAAAELTLTEADHLRARLPANVAARLIKTAFEWGQGEAQVPRRAAAIHQLGINMLRQPRTAGRVVLGLVEGAGG